ncbi:hypothetical protein BBJ28_00014228 [Nothophytophthora sp. Chile5]|nr:hypothetical protein BBJ28_00014228 [Nothophytophthora sp. Chile5]
MGVDPQAVARVHFEPKKIDGAVFVNAGKLKPLFHRLPALKAATLPDIVKRLKLPYRIAKKGKSRAVVSEATIANGYNPNAHVIYVDYTAVLKLDEVHWLLTVTYANDPTCANGSTDATLLYCGDRPCPILELDEHERFVDDGVMYKIEVRGERAPNKILFKAEDVASMLEMERLSNVLLIKDGYVLNEHYVVLSPTLQVQSAIYFGRYWSNPN